MEPKSAEQTAPDRFRIRWKDGVTTEYTARQLRLACPCAGCIEEWSGRRLLDPATVPQELQLVAAELVGRYALSFRWSDGHRTGIFAWPYLRQLGAEVSGA
jgi:DUF971 family protein